jgi:RNA polymerase sigma-70 factor, ECF subfamily
MALASGHGTGDAGQRDSAARSIADTLSGQCESLNQLVEQFYGDLRRMAHYRMRGEQTGHTLSPTALVHESYLKLGRLDRMKWRSRAHFFAEAAKAMRRVLVDHAVRRGAQKRGGDLLRVDLRDDVVVREQTPGELLALHEALEQLAEERPRQARVVECRIFAGMMVNEIAEALETSPATVKRDWQFARAWLNRVLSNSTTR